MKRQPRGFALLLVIWSLVMLASMATGFAYAVRHETRLAGDLAAVARAEGAGEAALRQAVVALGWDDKDRRWEADGQSHRISWPEASVTVRVLSESGRIDLNRAPHELLAGLFRQVLNGADPEALADAVMDWRDRDDRPRNNGAEREAYLGAGYAYGPTNRPFSSVNELSQVLGFDRDMVEAISPYLTIYSRRARLDAVTANSTVLAAVPGISLAEAEEFVAYRASVLTAGKELNYTELRNGRKYLDTRNSQRVFSIDTEVRLVDGFTRREHVVAQVQPARRFTILAREVLPAAETKRSERQ